ncbi:TMEM175 family protein [Secundilactobacillus paracollinoides]|uniref:TMEM175 family protein n=1 Tax=Secundilactobacillus paracollinoides TaxID=240427 RepID=UPI003F474F7F
MKAKLKERLDVFADAVIAIIITIMVMSLPLDIHNGVVDYPQLFKSIGIYLVSFCFIANLWYQHALVFNEAETVANRVIVFDLILLFLMSLMPAFTRLMTTVTNSDNVMLYGGLSLLISFIFSWISRTIIQAKYTDKATMTQIYKTIFGSTVWNSWVIYIVIIGLGYFFPEIALGFYLFIPLWSFFSHTREQEEFQQIDQMEAQDQQKFLALPAPQKRAFRRLIRTFQIEQRQSGHDRDKQHAAWIKFSEQAKTEFNISDGALAKWMKINGNGNRNNNRNHQEHQENRDDHQQAHQNKQ